MAFCSTAHRYSHAILAGVVAVFQLISPNLVPAMTTIEAQGRVVKDLNGNGKADPDEPGIPGVAVSNGKDVILTNSDGVYRLKIPASDGVITITQPRGFRVPLNDLNLPQFYYLHKPEGSPDLYYRGIKPTGLFPESVNFALRPVDEPDKFRALLFADTQIETSEDLRHFYREFLGEVSELGADLLINLGDIMYDHLDLFTPYNRAMARLGIPVFSILGNHDLNFDAKNDEDSDETFTALFGPPNYSWQIGQVHFVALDTILWNGREQSPEYRERLDEKTLTWLKNDLAVVPADRLIVLCLHAPLYRDRGTTTPGRLGNFDQLVKILNDRPSVLAVSGHSHVSDRKVFGQADGWKGSGRFEEMNCVTVSGSWWSGPRDYRGVPSSYQRDGVPKGYTILDINGTSFTLRYRAAGQPDKIQMRIYPPGTHNSGEAEANRRLLVNVFYGWADCRVDYSINNGPWTPMTQVPQLDPLAVNLYSGPAHTGKPFVRPLITNHIWQADLPEQPERGAKRFRVRVTWPDGHQDIQSVVHDR